MANEPQQQAGEPLDTYRARLAVWRAQNDDRIAKDEAVIAAAKADEAAAEAAHE